MVSFSNIYSATVDGKGRIVLPARLKRRWEMHSSQYLLSKKTFMTPV